MKGLFDIKTTEGSGTYTNKVGVPQYLPSNKKPHIAELYNASKYSKLMRQISDSNVPEEERNFLRLAASRHIVFNYSKIADYYAHASEEMQELMEKSALVILDIDDAIANGYVKLSSQLERLLEFGDDKRRIND